MQCRIPFLEVPAGLVATLRMHETEQEALRIDAAYVVDAFGDLDGVARPRHRERVLDAPAGIVMLEAIRHVLAVRIDESRAERVVVRADRQCENDEADEHRGQRGEQTTVHGVPSTRIRLPVDALCRIAMATRYPSESYQDFACS